MNYKEEIAKLIKIEGFTEKEIEELISLPKDTSRGEYCLPTFKLASVFKKAPPVIANEICNSITKPDFIEKIEVVGGYVNFKISRGFLAKHTLSIATSDTLDYGKQTIGEGKTICVDYSSINIAKPFHIGHLSTTVIGAAICRINKYLGYNVVGINHLGDWGTQFGKLIVAFKKWGNKEVIEKGGVREMLSIYVRFHEEAEKDEKLNEEARAWFLAIEKGEKEAVELFHWFKELTLKEVQKVYDRLGVQFDSYAGESFYNDKMQPILDELTQKGLLVKSDNADVVLLDDEKMPPCLLRKADGATLYATRDIAAAFYRKKEYDFYKCLYVVAYQQNLHFKQWFEVVHKMGYEWAKDLEHIAFGMVSLEGQALSTRKGNVVFLEEVLNKSVEKALGIITEKNPTLENKEIVAEQIGVGAVIWSALINNRIKDITFSYDKVLNFDGETAPYVQYTCVRANSILAKNQTTQNIDYNGISDDSSTDVIRHLSKWSETLQEASRRSEPSLVTRFIVDLAQFFNKFYIDNRIQEAEEGIKNARLLLTKAVANTIEIGLGLLGIQVPEKM